MQIIHDRSYVSQEEQELIARGYACESLYSLRFSYEFTVVQQETIRVYAGRVGADSDTWTRYVAENTRQHSEHMGRVAAFLAQNLTICQYDDSKDIPYNSGWDLLFWCKDFQSTTPGLLSGRDYSYFTLSFNDKHDHEQRQKIYHRVMRILELFSGDENLQVAVQYTALMDDTRVKHDAAIAAPKLIGRNCVYCDMEGRIESYSGNPYFREKRSRKYVYRLTDTEILSLSWQLLAQQTILGGASHADQS